MEQIKLDLIPGRIQPICHSAQYDVGRVIRINLMNGYSTAYTLDGTETVTLNVRKTDGNMITTSLEVVEGHTYVDMVTTQQITACYGSNLCNLTIEKGDTLIGTLTFILEVQRDPLDGSMSSESEIQNLEAQVREIIGEQYDSENVVFDSAPNAEHGVPYTVTSAGIAAALDDIDVEDLANVDISNPSNNQVIKYDAANNKWVNGPDVGAIDLNDIRDVNIDDQTIADGDALVYDANSGDWINAEAGKKNLSELNDVVITNPQDDDCIVYDSTTGKWINGEGGGKIWEGTQAQYDLISEPDPDVIYFITDGPANSASAGETTYDNTTSGLTADNVQDAIDEVYSSAGAVVELTYAQYQQLTPEQQANGTIYYVPDAPASIPTANDIAMSSSDSTTISDKITAVEGSIQYIEDTQTLASQSGITPYTHYKLFENFISNKKVIAIYIYGQSWDNPTTYTSTTTSIRVYGFKADSITVRVWYKV